MPLGNLTSWICCLLAANNLLLARYGSTTGRGVAALAALPEYYWGSAQ
jgi:hypothetical protein